MCQKCKEAGKCICGSGDVIDVSEEKDGMHFVITEKDKKYLVHGICSCLMRKYIEKSDLFAQH